MRRTCVHVYTDREKAVCLPGYVIDANPFIKVYIIEVSLFSLFSFPLYFLVTFNNEYILGSLHNTKLPGFG